METVVADTMAVNTKSRRVMVKCGLRFVRVFHEHFDGPLPGTEHGEVEYAVDRATWLAGQRA
jgi:RimJ/RimL family protein N-acetyltransferase